MIPRSIHFHSQHGIPRERSNAEDPPPSYSDIPMEGTQQPYAQTGSAIPNEHRHLLTEFSPGICLRCEMEQEALRRLKNIVLGPDTIYKVLGIIKFAFIIVFASKFITYLRPIALAWSIMQAILYSMRDVFSLLIVQPLFMARGAAMKLFYGQLLALWRDIMLIITLTPILARITVRLIVLLALIDFLLPCAAWLSALTIEYIRRRIWRHRVRRSLNMSPALFSRLAAPYEGTEGGRVLFESIFMAVARRDD